MPNSEFNLGKNKYLLLFLLFYYIVCVSQKNPTVYKHHTFWHKTDINQIFKNKFGLGFDYILRRKDEMSNGKLFSLPLRESYRIWFHYELNNKARFSLSPLGYMKTSEYIGKSEDYNRLPYHEYRSTFQFFHHYNNLEGRVKHTLRYRYELRWQQIPGTNDYRFFNRIRVRYRIRYIFNSNNFYENNIIYAMFSNEVGINFGKSIVYNTFNQNRIYAGLGYRFLNSARIELRYVNRLRKRGANNYEYDLDNGIMLALYVDQLSSLGKKPLAKEKSID